MPLPFPFNFKNPDYIAVFEWRLERYKKILKKPDSIFSLKEKYREDPAQFIIDWGVTEDPRNTQRGLPSQIPFLLFDAQEEWVHWVVDCWKRGVPGVTDKSREMGVTCLATALGATLCLFNPGLIIGFGSRKEEYVDKLGDPKCLLYKVRRFIVTLPPIFRGNWDERKHAPHMRCLFPDTNSIITGESGDNIGRGGRYSIFFPDESAWLSRPELIEASLSQATNCRMDISTPRGMNNPFARKVHNPNYEKRSLHWRQDPRKDQAWYEKKCAEIDDPVVTAQELDLNYLASVIRVLIPSEYSQAAVDSHITLGIKPSGIRISGFDVADEGKDLNAFAGRYGVLLEHLESWSGKGSDIFYSVQKVIELCSILGYDSVNFDSDGLGEGVKGDARVINETRPYVIDFEGFQGSGSVVDPEEDPLYRIGLVPDPKKSRTNEDFFANRKAQAWWALRRRFQITYRAICAKRDGKVYEYSPDDIISLSSSIRELPKLLIELSQPTFSQNNAGKMLIDKTPDGGRSPNLADAVMIAFAPPTTPVRGFFDV